MGDKNPKKTMKKKKEQEKVKVQPAAVPAAPVKKPKN